MQFSFLGYSVKKIMEFKLDVKDVAILRYFDDFRKSGKMKYELIDDCRIEKWKLWITFKKSKELCVKIGIANYPFEKRVG